MAQPISHPANAATYLLAEDSPTDREIAIAQVYAMLAVARAIERLAVTINEQR